MGNRWMAQFQGLLNQILITSLGTKEQGKAVEALLDFANKRDEVMGKLITSTEAFLITTVENNEADKVAEEANKAHKEALVDFLQSYADALDNDLREVPDEFSDDSEVR